MTIYVDQLAQYGTRRWCHMATDGDIEELHLMAKKIGLKREWFQNKNIRHPHYDLVSSKRALAIQIGAKSVSSKELIELCFKGET